MCGDGPEAGGRRDLVVQVLAEAEEAGGPEPASPKPLGDAERSLLLYLDGALKAISDVAEALSGQYQPGRMQRQLRELRQRIYRDIWQPRMALLDAEQRSEIMAQTVRWGYTIWAPEAQVAILRILERAADGRPPTQDLRKAARHMLDNLSVSLPVGKEVSRT
ncbi:MAG TPA: hypothetical protein VGK74_22300 [Symbiobacteriaceae bacterium]|jgi:hypothetical protein